MPIPNQLTDEEATQIYDAICETQKLANEVRYRGLSTSRITGEMLGCAEYHLFDWKWPADFAPHYVLKHKVRPTDEFLKFIGYDNKQKNMEPNSTQEKIREIIENSELHYTAGKIIDDGSFTVMIDELVEKLSVFVQGMTITVKNVND